MKWLTKSDYLKFLIHPAYLWLQKYDKDKLPPFDEAAEALVAQGNAVEQYARKLFPGGKAVDSLFKQAMWDTDKLVKAGERVVYQATVLTGRNLFAMADILVRQPDGSWAMYEVKSSTKTRDTHLADLAFQKLAFEEYGYQISSSHLIHIDNTYIRQGEIDPEKFLVVNDVTEQIDKILPKTKRNVEAALEVMKLPECPTLDPQQASNHYAWMEIYRHLHPDLPVDSIYNLCRMNRDQLRGFLTAGIEQLTGVPLLTPGLKSQQIDQISVTKAGKAVYQRAKISKVLAKLQFPLWFLDYETTFPAIPWHDGVKPYQQVPFQYSLHVLHKDGRLEQREFLAEGGHNPMPELLKHLKQDLGPAGSVIVWNQDFEKSVNSLMARHYPEYADFLKGVNRRVYDLMKIFQDGLYADPGFLGSASIKRVLPVLVPELSYKNLGIQEGATASRRWAQAAAGELSAVEAKQVYADLREYCGQDTLAMVKIYEFLRELVGNQPVQASLL